MIIDVLIQEYEDLFQEKGIEVLRFEIDGNNISFFFDVFDDLTTAAVFRTTRKTWYIIMHGEITHYVTVPVFWPDGAQIIGPYCSRYSLGVDVGDGTRISPDNDINPNRVFVNFEEMCEFLKRTTNV